MSTSVRENANRLLNALGPNVGAYLYEALLALESRSEELEEAIAADEDTGGVVVTDVVQDVAYNLTGSDLEVPGPSGTPAIYIVRIKVTVDPPGVLTFAANFKLSNFEIDQTLDTYAILSFYYQGGFYWPMGLPWNGFVP